MARLVKLGTKLGLVGATVYYTAEYGIWQDSSKTQQISQDLYSMAAPYLAMVPIEMPDIRNTSDMSLYAKTSWNHGVISAANFFMNLPDHTSNLFNKGYDWISQQMDEQNTPPGSETKI